MTRAGGARGHVAVSCVDLKLCPAGLLPMLVGGFRQGEGRVDPDRPAPGCDRVARRPSPELVVGGDAGREQEAPSA